MTPTSLCPISAIATTSRPKPSNAKPFIILSTCKLDSCFIAWVLQKRKAYKSRRTAIPNLLRQLPSAAQNRCIAKAHVEKLGVASHDGTDGRGGHVPRPRMGANGVSASNKLGRLGQTTALYLGERPRTIGKHTNAQGRYAYAICFPTFYGRFP